MDDFATGKPLPRPSWSLSRSGLAIPQGRKSPANGTEVKNGNVARAHAPRIHRQNLLIKAWKAALILADQLGIKAALTVAWNANFHAARIRQNRLATNAIAPIVLFLSRFTLQMMVHLRVQNPLSQRLL
jgi:hypothetical protein